MRGGAAARLKVCGLSRREDVEAVNEAGADFAGFIIEVPKSPRSVTARQAGELSRLLRPGIIPVGVFVNAPAERAAALAAGGAVRAVQLHGQEDGAYIRELRMRIAERMGAAGLVPVIQAFSVKSAEDIRRAMESGADYILLDHGSGGSGKAFDWDLLEGLRESGKEARPFFLAGGLNPENLPAALMKARPWAVDVNSGVETGGKKDRKKILAAAAAVRRWDQR